MIYTDNEFFSHPLLPLMLSTWLQHLNCEPLPWMKTTFSKLGCSRCVQPLDGAHLAFLNWLPVASHSMFWYCANHTRVALEKKSYMWSTEKIYFSVVSRAKCRSSKSLHCKLCKWYACMKLYRYKWYTYTKFYIYIYIYEWKQGKTFISGEISNKYAYGKQNINSLQEWTLV